MTAEDKELLIKDLSARLLYGVKFVCNKNVYTATGLDLIVTDEGDWEYAVTAKGIAPIEIDFIKPYLFPLSSMTEEQKKELGDTLIEMNLKAISDEINSEDVAAYEIDFYNKHHIDYRGFIEKSLAVDATGSGIYKMK